MANNTIYANIGTYGVNDTPSVGPLMQAQTGVVMLFTLADLTGAPIDLTDLALSGTITNNLTTETAALAGALTIVTPAAGVFSWTTDEDDVGTAGDFTLVFMAGADIISLPAHLSILETPGASVTFGAALIGVTTAERAWLTAALAALPDASDLANIANYLPLSGGTMTGLLRFSGADNMGIRLKNLTTAQLAAITVASGSLAYETDTNRITCDSNTGRTSLLNTGDLTTIINLINNKLSKTGDTMTGNLTITSRMQTDTDTTPGNTRLLLWDVDTGALARVSVGADDSGGAGYKVLRIPNG